MLSSEWEEEKAKEPPARVAELKVKEEPWVVEREAPRADGASATAPPSAPVLWEKWEAEMLTTELSPAR